MFQYRIRSATRHIPFRAAATLFTVTLSALSRKRREPLWLVSGGVDDYPSMELDVRSPFQRRMFYFPRAYWERLMSLPFGRFVSSALVPGSIFFDVGANIGFYTLIAAKQVTASGRVFSFEPDPLSFESLSRSVQLGGFDWARCFNLALSNREAELPFFYVNDGSAHSLVPEIESRADRYSGQRMVRVTTLDQMTRSGEITVPRIDLIKIDVEGEEARTVEGMTGTLEQHGWPRIWAEVRGPRGSTRAPNTFPAVREQLAKLGYAAYIWHKGTQRAVSDADVRGREDVLFERTK